MARTASCAACRRSSATPVVTYALPGGVSARGTRSCGAGMRKSLTDTDANRDLHARLDCAAADLAVALRRMPVADRQERAVDADRQEERRPDGQVAHVEIPSELRGRQDRVRPRRLGATPIVPGNGRHGTVTPSAYRTTPPLDVRDPQPRSREVIGEQPESGHDPGPSPYVGLDLEDLHLERVARPCAIG